MKTTRFILALLAVLMIGGAALPAAVQARDDDKPKQETFKAPKQGKQRLAYCFTPDKDCGK
jgi:hypothetical protein